MRGLGMRRPGSFFQYGKTFAQADDDLPYKLGLIHFEISLLILEYNLFNDLSKAPYLPRLGFAPIVSTHVTTSQSPRAPVLRWVYGGAVRNRWSSTGLPTVK
jgi:hypothetical protein